MDNYLLIIIWITVVCITLFLPVVGFLRSRDLKIDYSNKEIKYFIKDVNGVDYVIVPYFFWQKGKANEINKRFSNSITINGKIYNVDITYPDQDHQKNPSDLFPSWIYRDFRAKISKSQITNTNYGNINNTFVSGNGNLIYTHQENNNKISSEIEKVINNENFNNTDKMFLELFKYKLNENGVKKDDANKAIDILTKALPLTTAVINLIKSMFFA